MPSNRSGNAPLLGCIADDITGATDLAINLVQGGMRVVQLLHIPTPDELTELEVDAVVVALKMRSIPAAAAIEQSLAALAALRAAGCQRFLYKYCSTFDSTDAGNIGPIAEAMLQALDLPQTIFCPAFPRNGRTVYQGHLFVGTQLLHESGMQNHPINPMRDANLVRVLSEQAGGKVGLVSHADIAGGASAVERKLEQLRTDGVSLVITDCCGDDQLEVLAEACCRLPFLTGGSGIGRALPAAYRRIGVLAANEYIPELPNVAGRAAILSGSCSTATQQQIETMRAKSFAAQISVQAVVQDPRKALAELIEWSALQDATLPLLLYTTAAAHEVRQLQNEFEVDKVAAAIEAFHGELAKKLVEELGVRRLIVAGGETSGAVATALQVQALHIGPEICAGVPWTTTERPTRMALAFKSGNFGDERFFETALNMLTDA